MGWKSAKVCGKVWQLPVDQIEPSPYQARREFDEQEIARLSLSILQNGLLQPVSVRRIGKDRYELVAGERRLRACKLAGMETVPAIVCDYGDDQTAALGLLENIQRQNLNPFEQARGIREVIDRWGCTQEQAARRLGLAQPTLNNKLRLLQLTEEQQQFCLASGLTERHARAVLRLAPERRTAALEQIARQGMNARQTDAYIQVLLDAAQKPRPRVMVRDVRLFVNTINRAVRLMVDAGVPAHCQRTENEDCIEYRVRIPVAAACRTAAGKKGE